MTRMNRQIRLASYADGIPDASNFKTCEEPVGDPAEGELIVQTHYLSMDPFPRLRMSGKTDGPLQLPLDRVVIGRGVGQVVASRHADFAEGDFVAGELGWQTFARTTGDDLRRVDPDLGPVSSSLGVLGPSGLAAYFATLHLGKPQAGETFIINAAAGSVASIAGQIAGLQGARVVGIAGDDVQLNYIKNELGFDAAVDYKAPGDISEAIGNATPDGVDVFLDLVGGTIHDGVMDHINVHARLVLIGTIANYNLGPDEVDAGPRHLFTWILKRVQINGFMVGDYAEHFPEALRTLSGWLHEDKITYKETIFEGLEQCPQAFAELFDSNHVGKMLVKVDEV